MIRFERTCSRLIGKWLFSQDYLSPDLLCLILILFVILTCFILLKKKEDFSSPPESIISIFACLSAILMAVLASGPSVVQAMDHPPVRGEPSNSLPRSAASNSAVASTPSSSFFQGLSGQIPAAPDSPGEEVQQPNFLSLPEEDTMEHLLGAVPERGTAVSGVEGPSCSDVNTKLGEFLSTYGKTATRKDYFSRLVEELQLGSSDQEDRLKLFSIMHSIGQGDRETLRSEAGGTLVEEYEKYYKPKYGKSIYLGRNK
jgi:hypothetical protein